AFVGMVAASGASTTQLAAAQQLQSLGEEFLEVRDGAALEQHVPVRPGLPYRLGRLRTGGVAQQRLLTAAALPERRDVGFRRERQHHGVTVGAVVVCLGASGKL